MLAKLTSRNQITLPKSAVGELPKAEYFEVEAQDGRIVLTPVRTGRAGAVRRKLASLGSGYRVGGQMGPPPAQVAPRVRKIECS